MVTFCDTLHEAKQKTKVRSTYWKSSLRALEKSIWVLEKSWKSPGNLFLKKGTNPDCHTLEKQAENEATLYTAILDSHWRSLLRFCYSCDHWVDDIPKTVTNLHLLAWRASRSLYSAVILYQLLTVLILTWYFLPSWMIKRKELIRRKRTKLKCVRSG